MQESKYYHKETVLIIDFDELPENIQNSIREYDNFNCDAYLEYSSNLAPSGSNSWAENCTIANIENYRSEQIKNKKFNGSFEKFIEEYGLELDLFMIENNFDLDVQTILIKI